MHTETLRKLALALTFWIALNSSTLRAQIFTAPLQASTTGSNPVDFEFRADGTLIAKGDGLTGPGYPPSPGSGTLLSTDQGAGTRMLWFPSLGAFRAGTVFGTEWDFSNIGSGSVAFGLGNVASGIGSTASGVYSTASGNNSIAIGSRASASGYGAISLGTSNSVSGCWSTAIGSQSNASGWGAMALGYGNTASADYASTLGFACTASGNYSIAGGCFVNATGNHSISLGFFTTASGYNSMALGCFTNAQSYDSVAIGIENVGGGTQSYWIPTDPLFEIGNGITSWGYGNPTANGPSDAFVVYKNGNATLQGSLTLAPSGDIPMYTGN